MYTHIKNVQILISLLKQNNIKHIVISPGTRNTALAHSVETDDFFSCYSIVDERSAGFFALGIAEKLDVPVCITCTAATATCNYFPAVKEAYEKNLMLIALTSDRDRYGMFHMEDQSIDQLDMYHGFVNAAVDVPMIKDDYDYWYTNRSINEALLALNHNKKKGPVQINYHMNYSLGELSTFDVEALPKTRKINRINLHGGIKTYADELKTKNKILVVCGTDYVRSDILRNELNKFTQKFNCAVICDTFSNIFDEENKFIMKPNALGDVIISQETDELTPEIIISFGNAYYSTAKYFLPKYRNSSEHWQISTDGIINDGYRCLKNVFEGRPEDFFAAANAEADSENNGEYAALWRKRLDKFKFNDLKFTNFEVIKRFCKLIPENSVLHTSVLDSIRLSNYVEMNGEVKCFANVGADGIDGPTSTFLGQYDENELSFLLIGDLSFLYDMNVLLSNIKKNVRILVINNYAGAEFHKNFGIERINTIDNFVAAGHSTKVKWCSSMAGAEYMSAENADELDLCLEKFTQKSDKPIILEVFTDAHTDAETLKEYWKINRTEIPFTESAPKALLRKIFGSKFVDFLTKVKVKLFNWRIVWD